MLVTSLNENNIIGREFGLNHDPLVCTQHADVSDSIFHPIVEMKKTNTRADLDNNNWIFNK